jgi:hypothetical protein
MKNTTIPDPAVQIANLDALRLKYQGEVDKAYDEFEHQREYVMESMCHRLDVPESIDADWFRAIGAGLIRANTALAAAKQRLDHLNEVRAAMRGDAK